jgi:hypothetical protein
LKPTLKQLFGKRMIGATNLFVFKRINKFNQQVRQQAIQMVNQLKPGKQQTNTNMHEITYQYTTTEQNMWMYIFKTSSEPKQYKLKTLKQKHQYIVMKQQFNHARIHMYAA